MALGAAQDDAPLLSRLLFYWVNPLIDKGISGHLKKIDDLFDLPESLTISNISERLQNAIDDSSSLFKALHRSFGFEFYAIGILRFIADMSGFAGPLLLGALISERTTDKTGTDLKPYFYAMGLFASTLLSKLSLKRFFFFRTPLICFRCSRCCMWNALYLAYVIDWHENANGYRDSYLPKVTRGQEFERFWPGNYKSHVHRHGSHCEFLR